MKVVGIITEYNPFHNGHIIHIKKTIEKSNPDLLVCVMSPNYVMRGEFSVMDKFTRSEIALDHGVDIVLELPLNYTINSSDKFAYGAIKTLNLFGVNEIYFGSESDDIKKLERIIEIKKDDIFNKEVKKYLDNGFSYASSFQNSLYELYNIEYKSNDILGVAYLEAISKINKNIIPNTIKRENSNYHDKVANHENIASATAIRKMENAINYAPKKSSENMVNIDMSKHYEVIKNKLITEDLSNIHLASEGIINHLIKHIYINDYNEFLSQVTSKRYSTSRINRILLCILLNITNDEINDLDTLNYFRILNMNEKARNYINKKKKDFKDIIIVSNFKDYPTKYKTLAKKASIIYSYENFLKDLKHIPYKK